GVEAPPEHANDRAAFEEWQVERNPWNFASGEANHEVAPIPGHATQRRFRVAAADRIYHHVDALAAGQLLDALLEVFARVVDRDVCPVLATNRQLAFTRRGRNDSRSQRLAQLDRCQPDAACRAQNK